MQLALMMNTGSSSQWIALWLKPLASDNFCGEDASFSQEFEELKAEIAKDSSLHATNGTDWANVLKMASEFLAVKSKNIWALVYALYAFIRINGLEESAQLFAIFTEILTSYWESLYPLPERLQRRMAPFQWLSTRLELSAKKIEFKGEKQESIDAFKKECQHLQEFLQQKVGDNAPAFTVFFRNLTSPKIQPANVATESPENSVQDASVTQLSTDVLHKLESDARVSIAILPQLIRNLIALNRQLAAHLLAANMLDERAYQLHRAALWSTLLQPPPSDHTGKTQLTCGVPTDKIVLYSSMLQNNRYAELLPQLEHSASKTPFWFEGHYMVAQCLDGLEATTALNVVRNTLGQLLERFPELLTYKFQCGTPFAPSTIMPWLETLPPISFNSQQHLTLELKSEVSKTVDLDEIRLQEAISIYHEHDFKAGLLHICQYNYGKNRNAICHKLFQARYCLATGHNKTATKILYAIYHQLKQWNLLEWESDLTSNILSMLCTINKKDNILPEEIVECLYLFNLEKALNIFCEN